jgi:hypothetical protein
MPSKAFQHLFSSTPSHTPATFSDLSDSSDSISNSPPPSPTQPTQTLAMAAPTTALEPITLAFTVLTMPARGHSTALKFTPTQPHELHRYFKELEVLFARCQVTNNVERKKHVCQYLDIDTSDFWQSINKYAPATTYESWKTAIYKLYPGSEDSHRWTMTNMDKLVGE